MYDLVISTDHGRYFPGIGLLSVTYTHYGNRRSSNEPAFSLLGLLGHQYSLRIGNLSETRTQVGVIE